MTNEDSTGGPDLTPIIEPRPESPRESPRESTREERQTRMDSRVDRDESRPKRLSVSSGRRKLLRWIRIGLVIFAFLAVYDIQANFEFVRLPDSCSQIAAYSPGSVLLVNTQPDPENLVMGDVVMYSLNSGAITYGRLSPPPGAAPDTLLTGTGYWVLGDNPECPMEDSVSLGAIAPERIAGRVLFPLRF